MDGYREASHIETVVLDDVTERDLEVSNCRMTELSSFRWD